MAHVEGNPARPLGAIGPATETLLQMAQIFWRWGPALAAIWLAGDIAQSLIRWLAVVTGQQNRMGGVAVLTLAIVIRIAVVVAMFRLVAIRRTSSTAVVQSPHAASRRRPFQHDVAMVLVPFFLYYAAWGLLGDTMRQYALLSLALDPLGRFGPLLDIQPGQAAVVWTLGAWLMRRFAKAMQARHPDQSPWPFLIVIAEAMWIFVGLYLIDVWKDDVMGFFTALPAVSDWPTIIGAAFAAPAAGLGIPSDRQPLPWIEQILAGLRYAALPLVWFNLGAIIRGRDINTLDARLDARAAPVTRRWERLPLALRDFVGHFIGGIISRWQAVANAVQVMLGAGLPLLLTVIIGFRVIDWLAAWGIWATMQVIGPLPHEPARLTELALDLIWGTPRHPGNGLIPEVLKICLISAALDVVQIRDRARAADAPDADSKVRSPSVS